MSLVMWFRCFSDQMSEWWRNVIYVTLTVEWLSMVEYWVVWGSQLVIYKSNLQLPACWAVGNDLEYERLKKRLDSAFGVVIRSPCFSSSIEDRWAAGCPEEERWGHESDGGSLQNVLGKGPQCKFKATPRMRRFRISKQFPLDFCSRYGRWYGL